MNKRNPAIVLTAISLATLLMGGASYSVFPTAAQAPSHYFTETGRTVQGSFLDYWEQHGGLIQQGYPISSEMQEVSEANGRTYTVQYFERAVFELHPENADTPYEVLLSLLGTYQYQEQYGPGGASHQHVSAANPLAFTETGHTIGGPFRAYWEQHGGLTQQGYPISDEFQERSAIDGKLYTVQYFERAVFELHPENASTPYEVLLSQLGREGYPHRHGTLTLPPPLFSHAQDGTTSGNNTYLVWTELNLAFNPGSASRRLRFLNLRTDQTSSMRSEFSGEYAHYDSLAVWAENQGPCDPCKIEGLDLTTGDLRTLATRSMPQFSPKVSSKHLAWLEQDRKVGTMSLVIKELDTGLIYIVSSLGPAQGALYSTALNDEYLVWIEKHDTKGAYSLRAYNLETHQIEEVAQSTSTSGITRGLGLSGHYLVWANPHMQLTDLSTRKTTTLPAQLDNTYRVYPDLQVHGNTVVWSNETNIYGMKLTKLKPIKLVTNSNYPSNPTVAGGWLVWTERDDRLHAKRLFDAFAGLNP